MTTTRLHVRLVTAILVGFLAVLLGAAPGLAEDNQSALGRATDVCVAADDARSILKQLVKDGTISEEQYNDAAGLFRYNTDKVDAIKKDHEQRWNEIAQSNEDNRGFFANRIRDAGKIACSIISPLNAAIIKINESPFWNDPIGKLTKSVMEGNTQAIGMAMTLWMDFSTTSVDISANTQGIKNIVMGVAGFALAASFVIGGWRIVSARRGGLGESLSDINDNLVRWLVFSIAIPVMFPGAMIASDQISDAIMTQFGSADDLTTLASLEGTTYGPVVILLLALVSLAGSGVQILALVTRVLLAPIAAGLTPLFAALSFSDIGRQGLNHLVAYLIAAIAFKPVSALLYCVVLWNASQAGGTNGVGVIISVLMVGIAGFSAPALVRALVPAVSQAGGGGSAPMLAGATGALAAAGGATGAALASTGRALAGGGAALSHGGGALARWGSSSSGGGSAAGSGTANPAGGSGSGGSGASGGSGGRGRGGGSAMARAGRIARRGAHVTGRVAQGAGIVAQGTGKLAQGAGRVSSAAGAGLRRVGDMPHRSQQLFDDAIGYPGQAHR